MKKELVDLISEIEKLINELKSKISNIPEVEEKLDKINNEIKKPEIKHVKPENVINDDLKKFLDNPDWVAAVPTNLICDETNHEDKMDRARGVRDIFNSDYNYENKKILDFGTGYGHFIQALTEKNVALAVGYDIKNEFQISSNEKMILTTSWDEVLKNAPYDLVFLYDVIDHAANETPQDILIKAKSVLSNEGMIKMRCHPYIGKHGGHTYTKINKAYAHLILTPSELKELGHDFKNFPTIKVTTPLKTYSKFIIDAGLKTLNQKVINESAEQIFLSGKFAERIKSNLKTNLLLIPQMGMQFIDYTLSK